MKRWHLVFPTIAFFLNLSRVQTMLFFGGRWEDKRRTRLKNRQRFCLRYRLRPLHSPDGEIYQKDAHKQDKMCFITEKKNLSELNVEGKWNVR